jgi:hypothetical protein
LGGNISRNEDLSLKISAFLGVDVQCARGCPYVALDTDLNPYVSGWLKSPEAIRDVVDEIRIALGPVAVGIDSPRCALRAPRSHYWDGRKWRLRRLSEVGYGRHCEVVIAALRLANPQWTPVESKCPEWMRHGFRLFAALSGWPEVYEVFPTASYRQCAEDNNGSMFSISLRGFARGVKDMLDAYVAAFTVHEYLAGRGTAVGGGDGMGAIILPRKIILTAPSQLLEWPTDDPL